MTASEKSIRIRHSRINKIVLVLPHEADNHIKAVIANMRAYGSPLFAAYFYLQAGGEFQNELKNSSATGWLFDNGGGWAMVWTL